MEKLLICIILSFSFSALAGAKGYKEKYPKVLESQSRFATFHLRFIDAWVDMERRIEKENLGRLPNDKVSTQRSVKNTFPSLIDSAYADTAALCYFGGWPSTINPSTNECRRPWDEVGQQELAEDDRYKNLPVYGPSCERSGVIRCNPDVFGPDSTIGDYEGHCVRVDDEQVDWADQCRDFAINHQCLFYERLMNDEALRARYFENINRVVEYCLANDLYETSCQSMLGSFEELNIQKFYCENNLSNLAKRQFDVYGEAKSILEELQIPLLPFRAPLVAFPMTLADGSEVAMPPPSPPPHLEEERQAREAAIRAANDDVRERYEARVAEIDEEQESLFFTDSQGVKYPHYCEGILDSDIIANRSSWDTVLHEYSRSPAVQRTVRVLERHAHRRSRRRCAEYVKEAMHEGGLIPGFRRRFSKRGGYPECGHAWQCERELEKPRYGLINLMEDEDFMESMGLGSEASFCQWLRNDAPVGVIVVSSQGRRSGHMEIKTGRNSWISDFNQRSVIGCAGGRRRVTGIFITRPE